MKITLFLFTLLGVAASPAAGQFTDGHIFVTDWSTNTIHEVDPVGWTHTEFANASDGIGGPSGLGFTSQGHLLTANYSLSNIMEFDAAGNGSIVLDSRDGINGPWGENGLAIDSQQRVYVANYSNQEILRFNADYTGGTVFADSSDGIREPDGLGFAANGDLMVANRSGNGAVLRIDPAGTTSVWDTIPAEDCFSLVIRDNGDVYVACVSGNVFRYLGGDPTQRLLFGTWGSSNPGLAFSPDFSVLYHTNYGDGKLRRIDPDTGSATVVIDQGWGSVGITVAGSQFPPGSFARIGSGVAGTGGLMPTLDGKGLPRLGSSVVLETREFVGGALSYFLLSSGRNDLNVFSGTLYPSLDSSFVIYVGTLPGSPGVPGVGDEDRSFVIPSLPILIGTNWYFQQVTPDTGAVADVAMTNGLRMFIGE